MDKGPALAQRFQSALAAAIRPMAGLRGAGRVCRQLNRAFLSMAVSPIQAANMRDGTRMRVDLRSQTEWYAFWSGRYDDAAIKLIQDLMKQLGGDFLDVGGNIGMYAVRVAAGLGTGQRSLCFEPMPDNAERIRENAHLNGLDDRVEVRQVALSDEVGEAELVLREDFEQGSATGNASIAISDDADGYFQKIRVSKMRFDDIAAGLEDAFFPVVKVDIEGHEDFFLRGAVAWLNKDRPVILTEINNWFYEKRGTTSSAVFASSIPEDYQAALLRVRGMKSTLMPCSVDSLAGLSRVETCLLYPAERRDNVLQAVGR